MPEVKQKIKEDFIRLGKSTIRKMTPLEIERSRLYQLKFSYKGKVCVVNDNSSGIERRRRLIARDGGVILSVKQIL